MSETLRYWAEWWPQIQQGLILTVVATVASMALSVIAGLAIAVLRIAPYPGRRVVTALLVVAVDIIRGIPLIVWLFILYFGLPALGWTISSNALIVGILGLSLNLSAYLSEVFRAAILAVDRGQREAAVTLGMSEWKLYWRIVLPQAMLIAVPTVGGYFIQLIKDSALVGFISVQELLKTGIDIVSTTFRAFDGYMIVALLYLALSLLASRVVTWLERVLRRRGGLVGSH